MYRIVKYNGKFQIQKQVLFFFWEWVVTLGENYVTFDSLKEAKRAVSVWEKYEKERGEVVG